MVVDALRAVQTSGPTTPSTCLLRAGPFLSFWAKNATQMKIKEATKNEAIELKY